MTIAADLAWTSQLQVSHKSVISQILTQLAVEFNRDMASASTVRTLLPQARLTMGLAIVSAVSPRRGISKMLQDRPLTASASSSPQVLVDCPATASLMRSTPTTVDPSERGSRSQPVRGGTILAIDDNPIEGDLLARQLKQQGYVVATATNASQALRLLNAIPFDLIVFEAILPGIDGLELLRQLKQDEKLKHIPAIAISALEASDVAVRCIELGAEDYVHKPFDPILLQARISTCIEKKRLRDRELRYLQQVERLISAATAVETKSFNPDSLDDLSQCPHKLGQLARVFQQMARSIDCRERFLQQQIQLLQVSGNEVPRQGMLAETAASTQQN
jgi:PleD family two-component response regulator